MKAKHVWSILTLLIASGVLAYYLFTRAEQRQWDLTQAAQRGDLVAVKRLFAAGAKLDATPGDQNVYGGPALLAAAWEGHDDIVIFILDHGADVNRKDSCDNTALNGATIHGHFSTVQLLLSRGADPNICGEGSPLWNADGRNDLRLVELLKSYGAKE